MTRAGGILMMLLLFAQTTVAADPASDLRQLFDDERAWTYEQFPQLATRRGVNDYNHRLESVTPDAWSLRASKDRSFLQRLNRIDRNELPAAHRLNYDLFEWLLGNRLESASYREWLVPFTNDTGFHSHLPDLSRGLTFSDKSHYADYLSRLRDIPRLFDEHTHNLRQGVAEGITMPAVVMPGFTQTITAAIVDDVRESAFWTPFKNLPTDMPETDRDSLMQAGHQVLEQQVMPAYAELAAFFRDEYTPAARASIGIGEVPGGRAYYDSRVRYYTTLAVTAQEVHDIGVAEVKRIRAEMEAIIRDTGFTGSFARFLEFLRTDPQFYAKTSRELLMHAAYLAKKADGKLSAWFGHLPRQPYAVEPVPDHLAPNYTTGRYVSAPKGGTRPGAYWVNTHQLDRRPLYNLTALTLHEAVPGHHLQGALSMELEDVPAFRLGMYPHAFGEGWGLYSEKLGVEMGMYETPYDHFGRLSYEMWRACRLVVDTGMHAMGWSRDQAVALMRDNSALSLHNINTEVDRYISWPGQALAYKMGELTILRLRASAKVQLGARFDVRAFHDAVLADGGVPLSILEARIGEWVAAQQAAPITTGQIAPSTARNGVPGR